MSKNLRDDILDLSRQNNIGELTPWFSEQLDRQIRWPLEATGNTPHFPTTDKLDHLGEDLVARLVKYREEGGVSTVVLGMSGGVDSALTAALFKRAGWRVIGVTMPIHQNPEETQRGVEACEALGLEHRHIDLSALYDATLDAQGDLDLNLILAETAEDTRVKIRRGNVRARLRMITLYNLASMEGGLVASTDNFSELAAGFWTLHGDVGDLSPIQSLLKSWEVPYMSKIMGVPESTWRATPTDGLGISAGDEAQLGGSYLEWDLMVNAISDVLDSPEVRRRDLDVNHVRDALNLLEDERALQVFNSVVTRMGGTWFKRMNPVNITNYQHDRYGALAAIDQRLFMPASLLGSPEPITSAQA
jgi:nicotinamide-nucleotide amidase